MGNHLALWRWLAHWWAYVLLALPIATVIAVLVGLYGPDLSEPTVREHGEWACRSNADGSLTCGWRAK